MGSQDVAILLSKASSSTTFLMNCGKGESLGRQHVLALWLGVSKDMLPVKYFCLNKASFCIS